MSRFDNTISHGVDWEIESAADALWTLKITFISSHRPSQDPKEIANFMKVLEERLEMVRKEVRGVRKYYASNL